MIIKKVCWDIYRGRQGLEWCRHKSVSEREREISWCGGEVFFDYEKKCQV